MTLDINMLGMIMKNCILWGFDTTLIIAVNQSWIHLLTKEANQDLPPPNGLTCFLTHSHELCLCRIECNQYLFPVLPRNYSWPNTKDPFVLFWSDGLPIQSALVKPWIFTPYIFLYHNLYWEVPLIYLLCGPPIQLGRPIHRLTKFVTCIKHIQSCVHQVHEWTHKLPINNSFHYLPSSSILLPLVT